MSAITRRLTVPELTQQILDMAKTGVYRESIFEVFHSLATQKEIRAAIAHAKRFGLHSVASLRDEELGTYYQLDVVKYESLRHAIDVPEHLGEDAALLERLMVANSQVQRLLGIAKGVTIGLVIMGVVCLATGEEHLGVWLLNGGLSAGSIWFLQRVFAR